MVSAGAWLFHLYRRVSTPPAGAGGEPLRIVVMDPLCKQLACDCVEGYAQRDYAALALFLEERLGRPVGLSYGANLRDILQFNPGKIDLIIGKSSVVLYDAAEAAQSIRPIARLTNRNGTTNTFGLFVVRRDDTATKIIHLENRKILFGPRYDRENHEAALLALAEHEVRLPRKAETASSSGSAALAVVEGEADATVVSSYELPLLEGCGTLDPGALRVIGQTEPVPFVTVFATTKVDGEAERAVVTALLAVKTRPPLLKALESKAGFVKVHAAGEEAPAPMDRLPAPPPVQEWTDWRGPRRMGHTPHVPARLPEKTQFLWRRGTAGPGLAGVTATDDDVIVTDKTEQLDRDIFLCLDAHTGEERWVVTYATPTEMDFTNAPRAQPVIHDGLAYLLGAFGDLHCVDMDSSRIVWRRHLAKDFKAEPPAWGYCSAPLIVDDKLVVNPGGPDASLVALDRLTGEVVWTTPGEPAAYAAFILGTFGTVRQIVGYDAVSLGGWDPNTGQRLWTLLPEIEGDFNVPTPINISGCLLVTTENNGTRLYDFDANGRIIPRPIAQNADLAPDTSTPVVASDLLFGCFAGLYCLDLDDELKTLYVVDDDDAFVDYAALVAGSDRVLITSVEGELILIEANRDEFTPVSRLRPFRETEVWSHPALVGDRLYIRTMNEVCCLLLGSP
jgi:outer membrane protein assembly factor BamB/ABC-type phosphate/phosphonate transport system substrate-binding protein